MEKLASCSNSPEGASKGVSVPFSSIQPVQLSTGGQKAMKKG
jgi:hypothetical protein